MQVGTGPAPLILARQTSKSASYFLIHALEKIAVALLEAKHFLFNYTLHSPSKFHYFYFLFRPGRTPTPIPPSLAKPYGSLGLFSQFFSGPAAHSIYFLAALAPLLRPAAVTYSAGTAKLLYAFGAREKKHTSTHTKVYTHAPACPLRPLAHGAEDFFSSLHQHSLNQRLPDLFFLFLSSFNQFASIASYNTLARSLQLPTPCIRRRHHLSKTGNAIQARFCCQVRLVWPLKH